MPMTCLAASAGAVETGCCARMLESHQAEPTLQLPQQAKKQIAGHELADMVSELRQDLAAGS